MHSGSQKYYNAVEWLPTANKVISIRFRKRIVRLCPFLMAAFLTVFSVLLAQAGLRGPGKYCGVVVFDRWDTCFLLSGPYISYISNSVKNELRPYASRAMEVDATEVFQPQNPGDALIRKYKIIGPAPDNHRWAILDGLELIARSDFGPSGTPAFLIEIHNKGNGAVDLRTDQVAPALLAPIDEKSPFLPSDGSSMAVITRQDLVNYVPRQSIVGGVAHSWPYTFDITARPAERVRLSPGQSMKTRITFHVPPGKYQFMFGYGGGVHEEMSLASNAIAFDISHKGLTLAK